MSTKHNQNSYKLRNVFITLLFVLISIFLIGILTRSPNAIKESEVFAQANDSTTDEVLNEIRNLLEEVRNIEQEQLELIQKIQKAQEENAIAKEENEKTEKLKDSLTGPALYASYVDDIIEKYYPDLDANYIKAIIYRESRYQPNEINKKTGVKGLMQISPKWHTQRANNLGVTDLLDPYGNILVGCDILNEMTQKYNFNYALNYFAGGYKYANRYKNSTSPCVKELNSIAAKMKNGEIILGGE